MRHRSLHSHTHGPTQLKLQIFWYSVLHQRKTNQPPPPYFSPSALQPHQGNLHPLSLLPNTQQADSINKPRHAPNPRSPTGRVNPHDDHGAWANHHLPRRTTENIKTTPSPPALTKKKENFENKENSKLWNRKKKEDRILNIKDISPQNKVYTKLRNLKKGSHTIQKCFNPQTRNPRAKRLQVDRMERE